MPLSRLKMKELCHTQIANSLCITDIIYNGHKTKLFFRSQLYFQSKSRWTTSCISNPNPVGPIYFLSPEAELVSLVGQMLSAVKVEGLEGAHARLREEVLRAPGWRPVVEVARVLSHLL